MSPRAKGKGGGQRGGDSCVILRNVSACTTATKLRLLYVTSAMHSPLFLVFFVFLFFFSVIERTVRVAFVRIERAADLRACRSTDGQEYLGSEASC